MRSPHGLQRYAQDLPVVDRFVTLGEGNTPMLPLENLAERLGLRQLFAKMESSNPTGSYKDRAAAMSLSLARSQGYRGWIATSSGNAGLAMAAYGTRAGLPGFLCLVGSAPVGKRMPLMTYGISIAAVDGVGLGGTASADEELFHHVATAAKQHHLFLGITAHAFNAEGMRGIDTIGYELAEQLPEATHVYAPVGGGGLISAIGRGLRARAMGASLVACQPSGCAPVVRFLEGTAPLPEVEQCSSRVSGLQLARPPDGAMAAEAVRRSGGWGTAVDDHEIYAAQRMLSEGEGVSVEPAAAVGLAALIADRARGRLKGGDQAALVLTGAGWKDLEQFRADADRISGVHPSEIPQRIKRWAEALTPKC